MRETQAVLTTAQVCNDVRRCPQTNPENTITKMCPDLFIMCQCYRKRGLPNARESIHRCNYRLFLCPEMLFKKGYFALTPYHRHARKRGYQRVKDGSMLQAWKFLSRRLQIKLIKVLLQKVT
jgi:hypothetical protein